MEESGQSHPLDGTDPNKCYDVMMTERTSLITAKRESEDELVRTIIKLSSASLLIVPTVLISKGFQVDILSSSWLNIGFLLFALSMLVAMFEQYFSSKAYDRQILISVEFYQKKSTDTSDSRFSQFVRVIQTVAFTLFALGIGFTVAGLLTIGGK